jgi:hypothetical protein
MDPDVSAPAGGGRGGAGGGRGGAGRGNVVQLPIPSRDIGPRGIQVSPGTYTVTLDVDGNATTRSFEVRGDPAAKYTVAEYMAREAFLLDVQETQAKIMATVASLRTKRQQATAGDSTKLQALERRLTQASGRIGRIPGAYNGSGAQQGSFAPPTAQSRSLLAEAKAELAAVSREGGIR